MNIARVLVIWGFVQIIGLHHGLFAQASGIMNMASQATLPSSSQNTNTEEDEEEEAKRVKIKRPRYWRATYAGLMSAGIPGLGQVYNRKYWKIAIAMGLVGVPMGLFIYNFLQYGKAIDHYWYLKVKANEESDKPDPNFKPARPGKEYAEFKEYTEEQIRSESESFQTNYETAAAFMVLGYALNILDAIVDAYFTRYDMSPNLSIQLRPSAIQNLRPYAGASPVYPGLKLTITF